MAIIDVRLNTENGKVQIVTSGRTSLNEWKQLAAELAKKVFDLEDQLATSNAATTNPCATSGG
jgi:hypothetical protein